MYLYEGVYATTMQISDAIQVGILQGAFETGTGNGFTYTMQSCESTLGMVDRCVFTLSVDKVDKVDNNIMICRYVHYVYLYFQLYA